MSVTTKDKGASKVTKALAEGLPSIEVGILQGDKSSKKYDGTSPATVLEVANFQEFGTNTIPARPFVSGWFDKQSHLLTPTIAALAAKVVKGELTPSQYVKALGNLAVGGIQKYISQGIPPALAASTVKRKGSSTPLIDTGLLRSSITFREGSK